LKIELRKKGKLVPSDLGILVINRETRSGEQFRELMLDGLSIIESSLRNCAFENIRVRSASLGEGVRQSLYEDCVFKRCKLAFGAIGNARLVRCRFESCRLDNLLATELELIGCAFPNTVIKKGVFHGRVADASQLKPRRVTNEFVDNDFSDADLVDVDFRGGIDLNRQKFPTGDEYLFVRDTCKALAIAKELRSSITDQDEIKRSQMLTSLLDFYCSQMDRKLSCCVYLFGAASSESSALVSLEPSSKIARYAAACACILRAEVRGEQS
jgi:hypothetical protein